MYGDAEEGHVYFSLARSTALPRAYAEDRALVRAFAAGDRPLEPVAIENAAAAVVSGVESGVVSAVASGEEAGEASGEEADEAAGEASGEASGVEADDAAGESSGDPAGDDAGGAPVCDVVAAGLRRAVGVAPAAVREGGSPAAGLRLLVGVQATSALSASSAPMAASAAPEEATLVRRT